MSEMILSLAVKVFPSTMLLIDPRRPFIKSGFAYWSVVGCRNVFISCKQRSGNVVLLIGP